MFDNNDEGGSAIGQRMVGVLYVVLGALGILLNLTTVAMIVTRRVYRLSAYTIMANVALADALMMIVIGVACGASIIFDSTISQHQSSAGYGNLPAGPNADKRLPADVWLPSKRTLFNSNFEVSKQFINTKSSLNNSCENIINSGQNLNYGYILLQKKRRRRRSYWQLSQNFAERRKAKMNKNNNNNSNNNNDRRSAANTKNSKRKGGFGQLKKRSAILNIAIKNNIFINEPSETEEKHTNFDSFSQRIRRSLLPLLDWNSKAVRHSELFESLICFVEIAAWTAGVLSYAFLGLNRCVAICYYGTKAKYFNRVSVAIVSSVFTWIVGIGAACVGTFPISLVQSQPIFWSLSFVMIDGNRSLFIILSLSIYTISVILQWICSTLVLIKIHQVKKKISCNKLNENSAIRFKKQARLTFQFFYPSLFCTFSSFLHFAKPFCKHILSDSHFILLHIIWLGNHLCNPFIYAYFNERMRLSYREFLTCARLRLAIMKRRRRNIFKKRGASRHSTHQRATHQMSTRSAGAASCKSNGNFVRNSLQMQSRDFEQLCEFMMRVNPLYDSSEGWRESSSTNAGTSCADYGFPLTGNRADENSNGHHAIKQFSFRGGRGGGTKSALESRAYSEALANGMGQRFRRHRYTRENRSSRSIVLDLGRQTVEHWALFAKKASI